MKKEKKYMYISVIFTLILIIVLLTMTINLKAKSSKMSGNIRVVGDTIESDLDYDTVQKEVMTEKLGNMSERSRIEYYITNFLSYAEDGQYEKAYNLLYADFKANYFPTVGEFATFAQKNFNSMEDTEFTNIERQGKTYVMWVTLKDVLNSKKDDPGKEYTFVVRENGLNDIELSFSLQTLEQYKEAIEEVKNPE